MAADCQETPEVPTIVVGEQRYPDSDEIAKAEQGKHRIWARQAQNPDSHRTRTTTVGTITVDRQNCRRGPPYDNLGDIIMFRSRVTLEEYLKSIQHEDAAGEDVSLDDIDMIADLEEEEVEHVGENIFESRVSINMNPSLINILDNFKDDKEDIDVDIVKRKTGASEVVFSEATVPIETFAYHKLMGPESSGRGDDVEENQTNNTPLVGEIIRDSLTATATLAKNNEVYIKDTGQIENTTVLGDKGGAAHTSRSPHVLNQVSQQRRSAGGKENIQPNSLQGVNKSCQIGKKHISAANRMENFTIGMPRPHNFVN
ncbi:hypothetical protein Cgig2_001020 [Carnegiea gigantea]|uniref:Uncharacterized protein n=1 Tax=Carnegiea gigantea TaxID=171969 RepID=A0A9Q1JQ21_9CARY|nr:hypothetical protein Cgig2_001020 [Carnegiea gigantea]